LRQGSCFAKLPFRNNQPEVSDSNKLIDMRIALADPHKAARTALEATVVAYPNFELVGESQDSEGLIELASAQPLDLILLDGDLPGSGIEELITWLHTLQPRPIVITMSCKVEDSRRLLRAGADCFISKGDSPEWLLEQLQKYSDEV
jgi:two-component system, NarL family, invasion response regulator UvrY